MANKLTHIFKVLLVCLCLLFSGELIAQTKWDTLYFKNGQIVFGNLKKIDLGYLTFDGEDLSLMTIKISKIKTIAASKKIYRIETTNHKNLFSTIKQSDQSGYVNVGDDKKGWNLIYLRDISSLSYFNSEKNIWEGNISSGYSYSKNSNIGRFNLDGSLRYLLKKAEFSTSVSSIITQQNASFSRDNESVNLTSSYFFSALWKGTFLLNYQRNLELGLARRYQEGIIAGINFLSGIHTRADIMTGLTINQEKSSTDDSQLHTAEWPVLFSFHFFKFSHPELSIGTTQNIYTSLSQKGRVRHDGEIKIDWKIIKDFTVNLKLYDNYDSQPNSSKASNLDYGIVFGLGYKFD